MNLYWYTLKTNKVDAGLSAVNPFAFCIWYLLVVKTVVCQPSHLPSLRCQLPTATTTKKSPPKPKKKLSPPPQFCYTSTAAITRSLYQYVLPKTPCDTIDVLRPKPFRDLCQLGSIGP